MTSHSSGNYVTFDKTTIDAPARLEAGTCDAAASSESETRRGRQQTGCMLDATRVGGFTLTMRTLIFTFVCVVLVAQSRAAVPVKTSDTGFRPINGPLKPSRNPNFFVDASGTSLVLCGSHSWNTLQDWGSNGSIRPLDFDAFVGFLKAHGHNFTLLWCTELPKFHGLPTTENSPPDFTVSPFPWRRTGPGSATDGGLKFDLTEFNEAYFARLRARAQALRHAGIYAGVYLFTGEWLLRFRCPTDGYPFSGPNNVNGVDDGYRGGSLDA